MPKAIPIKGKDGKFKGSIGSGKTDVPTPSYTPTLADLTETSEQPDLNPVSQQYTSWLALVSGKETLKDADLPVGVSNEVLEATKIIRLAVKQTKNMVSITAILQEAETRVPPEDVPLFLDKETTVAFLEQTVPHDTTNDGSTQEKDFHRLLQDVRSGRTVFTQRELQVLAAARDIIIEQDVKTEFGDAEMKDLQEQASMMRYEQAVAEDELWDGAGVLRRCTLCGQFVGARSSHMRCPSSASAKKANAIHRAVSTSWEDVNPGKKRHLETKLFGSNPQPEGHTFYQHDPLPFTNEELEDYFIIQADLSQRNVILSSFVTKKMFGEPEMHLPDNIRKAFCDVPVKVPLDGITSIKTETQLGYARTIIYVAAMIEPPLTRKEISRVMDVSGIYGIEAFLDVNRTREIAYDIIATSPSDCAAVYVQGQSVPDEVIERMVASPDPLIRREACLSRDYDSMEEGGTLLSLLATDPDDYVRYALLDTQAGFSTNMISGTKPATADRQTAKILATAGLVPQPSPQIVKHPELLDIFVNDPDYDTAVKALDVMPMNRRTMASISEVRDPERLQKFRDHYYMMSIAGREPYVQVSDERNAMVEYLDRLIESRTAH